MTGTGTQADPYIVDSWPDFVTAVGKSGAYVKVVPGLTWDMNEIASDGISTLAINCASINGNGLKILALRATGDLLTINHAVTIRNTSILSFTANRMIFGAGSVQNWYIRHYISCIFTGNVSGDYVIRSGFGTPRENQFEKCGLNVSAVNANFANNANNLIKDSCIFLDVAHLENINCYNSYIAGTANSNATIRTSSSVINLSGNATIAWDSCDGVDGQATSVYNQDTLPNTQPSTTYKVVGVTDSQIKDSAYLATKGLTIGMVNYG